MRLTPEQLAHEVVDHVGGALAGAHLVAELEVETLSLGRGVGLGEVLEPTFHARFS